MLINKDNILIVDQILINYLFKKFAQITHPKIKTGIQIFFQTQMVYCIIIQQITVDF